ncbi:Dabb family protein [bacterium]|nr:Dabb family protein [bacterium]
MIRHVVALTWNEGASDSAVALVGEGFARLSREIPEIKSYSFGPDLAIFRGNADYGLVAGFESEEDFKTYVHHPSHQAFMREVTGPITASFMSVQFVE